MYIRFSFSHFHTTSFGIFWSSSTPTCQGFGGYLQLAKPDIFACSELEPPILPEDEGSETNRNLRLNVRNDRLSMDSSASRNAMEAIDDGSATGAEDGLPAAVVVSRSLPSDPDRCTFEKKVGTIRELLNFFISWGFGKGGEGLWYCTMTHAIVRRWLISHPYSVQSWDEAMPGNNRNTVGVGNV